jgi:hypothetical protein
MNINLHIERLVLDGLPLERGQEPLLRAAVQAELARLITADGLSSALTSGGATPRLQAGQISLSRDSSSRQLGQQIARAVYGGLGR